MKALFGIPCPGCGGTRAIIALLQGRVFDAIYYHAFVVYCVAIVIYWAISWLLGRFVKADYTGFRLRMGHFYVAIGIIFVQYILKLAINSYVV